MSDKPINNFLDLPEETSLSLVMHCGAKEVTCDLVIPTWTFKEKLVKREEFAALGKALEEAYEEKVDGLKLEASLSDETFVELRKSVGVPDDFEGFKAFFLDNVVALDGLKANVMEDGKKSTLMLIRKEHKLFKTAVEDAWQYDFFIFAARDAFKRHLFSQEA